MNLPDRHLALGANLAPDGIPLHYGNVDAEYHAALYQAVIMDRSHEGRIESKGRDWLSLIQRISTNDVLNLSSHTGQPTIFTNPNGRILDRAVLYNRGESGILTTDPGRGAPLLSYLQRQIFFNDDAAFTDLSPTTRLFTLHGPQVDSIIEQLIPGASHTPELGSIEATISGIPVFLARRKPVSGQHWVLIVANEQAETVWMAVLENGTSSGLIPAGSLAYNALRIRAGRPAAGRELTLDYIPLEAGLWDEVSFTKGCYTGQEIIARMESRNRLAKTLVKLRLTAPVETPANLIFEGKSVGTLTSSVTTPDQEILGIAFVKVPLAIPQQELTVNNTDIHAVIIEMVGVQPSHLPET
jgi:tRNA-modifying protein YgfZ